MSINFITGNKNKLLEIKAIIPNVVQLNLDLPEIQSLEVKQIIKYKLEAASKANSGEFIVEDTCLYLNALQGLPGPLIKWFMESIGYDGLYKITKLYKNFDAEAKVVIGYKNLKGKIIYFEGVQKGTIVKPKGKLGWGWDPIFKPEGFSKTYAEMTAKEKHSISMRKIAAEKLRKHLGSEKQNKSS